MKKIITKSLWLVVAFMFVLSTAAFAMPTETPEEDLADAVALEENPAIAEAPEEDPAIAETPEFMDISAALQRMVYEAVLEDDLVITDLPWMGVNVRIHNGTGNLVIEGNSGTTSANGNIDLWTYWENSTYYQWRLVPDANHEYVQFRRYTTSLATTALAPTGGTVAAETRLTLIASSTTADSQWWKPELQANGRYVFSNKANPNLNMRIEWPYNYVEAIKEALAGEKTLLIPAAFDVLRLLRKDNIPYTLCYPQRDAKEVYRKRYLDRGNTEDFLEIFIGGWERFLDYLEQDTYGQHIVMQPHEFLSDVITCDKGCAVYTMDERLKELKQKTLNSIKNGFCIEINKLTELWKNFIIARKI